MKTFEDIEEAVRFINEMEEIFRNVVVIACHERQIQRYRKLKDRVNELLVKNVWQVR